MRLGISPYIDKNAGIGKPGPGDPDKQAGQKGGFMEKWQRRNKKEIKYLKKEEWEKLLREGPLSTKR